MIQAIQQVRLLEILPPSIKQDAQLSAVAKSLESQLQRISAQAQLVLHLPRLNELGDEMLNVLAEQYHVDYFEPENMSLETKRALIRDSLLEHQIRGTKASVEHLLNKIMTWAKVSEWWEYGGEAYYFRVTMQGLKFTDEHAEKFFRIINSTKNVRSWLELITFDLTLPAPDTTLHVAQPLIDSSDNFIDLGLEQPPPQVLTHSGFLIDEGCDTFDLDCDIGKMKNVFQFQSAVLESINEVIDCEREEIDYSAELEFERYIRWKWREFRKNPVIEYYGHHGHEWDGEIEPDEPEYFPLEQDFLRLYFSFPNTATLRYITLLNPQENLSGADIRAVGEVSKGVLLSRRGLQTNGIVRALYIHKREEKVL